MNRRPRLAAELSVSLDEWKDAGGPTKAVVDAVLALMEDALRDDTGGLEDKARIAALESELANSRDGYAAMNQRIYGAASTSGRPIRSKS